MQSTNHNIKPSKILITNENNKFTYFIGTSAEQYFEIRKITIPPSMYSLDELGSTIQKVLKGGEKLFRDHSCYV